MSGRRTALLDDVLRIAQDELARPQYAWQLIIVAVALVGAWAFAGWVQHRVDARVRAQSRQPHRVDLLQQRERVAWHGQHDGARVRGGAGQARRRGDGDAGGQHDASAEPGVLRGRRLGQRAVGDPDRAPPAQRAAGLDREARGVGEGPDLLRGPDERLRVRTDDFDWSGLGARMQYTSVPNCRALAEEVLRFAPGARRNAAVEILLSGGRLSAADHDSPGAFEREERWLLSVLPE